MGIAKLVLMPLETITGLTTIGVLLMLIILVLRKKGGKR